MTRHVPKAGSQGPTGRSRNHSFLERQEVLLAKTGRSNATHASRTVASMQFDPEEDDPELRDTFDGAVSLTSRFSKAPSVHPSLAGSVAVSQACSEATIGAGDDTRYWDFQHRKVEKRDLGQRCRECRRPFVTFGDPLTERRGARISMRYHGECFSGFADPRSQTRSSHHEGHHAGSQMVAAPTDKAGSKMRTSLHFEGGRVAPCMNIGGKLGAQVAMGHNSFGSRSSKGHPAPIPQRRPGGFTEAQLAAHNCELQQQRQRTPGTCDSGGE